MNFRSLARSKLDSLLLTKSNSPRDPQKEVIDLLNQEISKTELSALTNFVNEYHGRPDYLFGYLFEPYGDFVNISPLLRKSRKPRSPYFCLKIPVKSMGNIFLIPTTTPVQPSIALVLKPDRPYRQVISAHGINLSPLSPVCLYSPYSNLMEYLISWAMSKEAILRV